MHKLSEVAVTLERDGQHTPWGIRLVGGSDLDTPLIITKVRGGGEDLKTGVGARESEQLRGVRP